ncbi:MAG: SAM-dependent methyltransferase [Myxococcota bacterium]
MTDTLEPFTPYEESLMWRVHHAYFAQRGAAVWTEKEIPSQGTSNGAQARAHARLLAALVADRVRAGTLAPGEIVWVLEPGAGSGDFAAGFLKALEAGYPELAERTRYLMTDYVARTVREAAALPKVAPWVAAGKLVPAVYDLRAPSALTDLEGAPLEARASLVIANYVCCALPMKPLQKHSDGWYAPWVETRAELGGEAAEVVVERLCADATRPNALAELETRWEWRPFELEGLGAFHAAVLARTTAALPEASVFYPALWLDFLRGVAPRLAPGGVVVTNDYGFVGLDRLEGLHERRPEKFANCLGQEVQFAIFDAFAAVVGWDVARTHDPLDEIHQAVVGPSIGGGVRAEVGRRPLWGRPEWAHLLDFQAAAQHFTKHGDLERALRFWQRCAEIDPDHVDFHHHIGEVATEVGLLELAQAHLARGFALDPDGAGGFDWEHMLARVASMRGDVETARVWYKRSLAREPHPVTCINLAALAFDENDLGLTYRWLERALMLDPEHALANQRMVELRERVWELAKVQLRNELPVDPDDIVVDDDESDDVDDGPDEGEDEPAT